MGTNSNEYNKRYYQLNKERRRAQIRERNDVAIKRNQLYLLEYLQGKTCILCGFSYHRALQFDHRDPDAKKVEIATMVSSPYSWDAIMEEIGKCDVLCANCHSIKTCESRNFYKAGLAQW